MAQLNVTELDFNNIKQNLKAYLSSQEEFSDFNFEGSALNVLMDTLAYNTHYNGMLAHMLANENFLDSAIKRSSVVSLAKALGYTPVSKRAASARVNILLRSCVYTNTLHTKQRHTI
jgi:glycyl-tRNA synthetase alpha subunit